jgi:hypothetical protein
LAANGTNQGIGRESDQPAVYYPYPVAAEDTPVEENPTAKLNASGVEFLHSDAELALTFADLALASSDSLRAAIHRKNARAGYDTVVRLRHNLTLSPQETQSLEEKILRLKSRLVQLGEIFSD